MSKLFFLPKSAYSFLFLLFFLQNVNFPKSQYLANK